MAFDLNEISTFLGKPVEFYHFQSGGRNFRQNPTKQDRQFQGFTYESHFIERTEVKQERARVTDLEIILKVARDNPVTDEFRLITPARSVYITIYKKHINDPGTEYALSFSGLVRGCVWKGDYAELRCEPISVAVKRAGLRLNYQISCNHYVYSNGCRLNSQNFRYDGTVVAISGSAVTINFDNPLPAAADYFELGFVEFGNFFYFIVGQVGSTITLFNLPETLNIGDTVACYAGCNRTLDVCWDKFENGLNYGGFPYSPAENIFETGV